MISVGNGNLSYSDVISVLIRNQKIDLDKLGLKKVENCHQFLIQFASDKLIYGINTGFGPMAQYRIDEKHRLTLQYNLIRSHSSGSGDALSPIYAKSVMLARLNTLMLGYSGIHTDLVNVIKEFINHDIIPFIPEHGSVGASGDLVQLAHFALNLIGEGEVFYENKWQPTADVLKKCNIKPLQVHLREGLAIMNGTASMTGIGLLNVHFSSKLLEWSLLGSALLTEAVESYNDHFSKELNQVKLHRGQNIIADVLRKITADSKLVRRREEHLYDKKVKENILSDKVQEYYSLRCIPQILGPVYDTIRLSEQILIDEVNSVNDNPIVDVQNANVYHGGNFHGDYIALEMDKVKIAVTKMSMLLERQLNYLMNAKLNNKFPPFANLGTLGLNFGMQGVQFTAVSTTAENQTLAFPMYIHSIPNNNDNQDIVSMGTNAALICKKVIYNSFEVLAIHLISTMQVIDAMKGYDKLSSSGKKTYDMIRKLSPSFTEDSPKYKEIALVKEYLMENSPEIFN